MSFEPASEPASVAFLDQHPLPVWMVTQKTFRIRYLNKAAADLTAFSTDSTSSFLQLFTKEQAILFRLQLAKTGLRKESQGQPFQLRAKEGWLTAALYFSVIVFEGEKSYQVTAVPAPGATAEDNSLLLARLVEQTSDILTASDLDFRPITWNRAAEKVYGVKAKDVIGRDVSDFITFSYKGTNRVAVRDQIARQGEWRGEASFVRPTDKRSVTLLLHFKLLRDAEGEPVAHLISGTDITERIKTEARLRESEDRFRRLADVAPVMVWMCDAGQKMIYASKMWQAFTGMDGIGEDTRSWGAFIHPDDRQRARENFETGFQKRERISTTYRLCKKDGSYRWVLDTSVPRFLNDETFMGYIGCLVDIEEQKQREDQLQYQATILNKVSDIIVTLNSEFQVTSLNDAAKHVYGLTEEEALGRRMSELVSFRFYRSSLQECISQLTVRGFWGGEVSITVHGEEKYFLHKIERFYDERHQDQGYISYGTDITERKKMEEQLISSEQFHRALVADSLDGTLLMDADGTISFCSSSVKNILGFEAGEVEGRNGFEFVHPEDIGWAAEAFQREVSEAPELKFIVVRLLKKSGDWVWCMVRGHNLLRNPLVNKIVVYFHDDTLRKQATDALKESEKRFRTLVKDLQIGVLLQDAEGNILLSNNAMNRLFDVKEEELLGKQIWKAFSDVIGEDGRQLPVTERPSPKAIRTKKLVKDKVMGVWHPQRKERIWLLINADPILDEGGNVQHVVCSFINITERKRLEQKLMAEQISHQRELTQATIDAQEAERREIGKELHDNFGQQLTTIKLFLDMAKSGATEGGAEMINMALKSVIDVINEIRSMSRSLIPQTLKDLGLVDSVNELIESIGHAQPFAIQFVYDDFEEQGLPENQKLTLFRIIQEQLNNIVKYAGAKEVSILLKTTIQSVVLQISDDGRGFDERKVRKGLGFTNIRNRAELFGGKAEISSVPGSGCTLQVSMPVTFSRSSAFPTSFN